MDREVLVDYLDNILMPQLMEDATYNGLQVEGGDDISRIGFAVDACLPVFQQAVKSSCDMLVVHHGLIWGGLKSITGATRQKVQLLLDNNINLYVSHLPLDKHIKYGNNVQIIQSLGAVVGDPVLEVAYTGDLCETISYDKMKSLVREKIGLQGDMHFGPNQIKVFAVSSGSFRPSWLAELHQIGINTVLTGEGSSASLLYYPAQEYQMNILFGGHYATEVFGVQSLQRLINKDYKSLNTEFIDMQTGW